MITPVAVGKVRIGDGQPLALFAGPCVIESEALTLGTARALADTCAALELPLVFKASWDKANRSSGASFRGPGLKKGLEVLRRVRKETGLPVMTDLHEPGQAELLTGCVDCLQIPAFLCRQTDLIVAAAKTGLPVNIKKGQFLAPWDMAHAVEKARQTGNPRVLLTERGSSFGYNNLVVDFRSLPVLRGLGCPVIFDATHSVQLPGGQGAVSGGQREYVAPLARAAAGAGIDALFLEVHPEPGRALSDGPNAVSLRDLPALLNEVLAVDRAVRGRDRADVPGTLTLCIDGGSRGNPGEAGIGVVILAEDGKTIEEFGRRIGHATNNVAEYEALLAALKRAVSLGARRLTVLTDSELLARQMNGQYKVKDPKMAKLHREASALRARFETAVIRHVPREENREADRLVNEALDGER